MQMLSRFGQREILTLMMINYPLQIINQCLINYQHLRVYLKMIFYTIVFDT